MFGLLAKLIHLGGFLNGSKTVLGIVSVAVAVLQQYRPDLAEIVIQLLGIFGVSLLPVGIADKIRKARRGAFPVD
jgi:hypothetical protein